MATFPLQYSQRLPEPVSFPRADTGAGMIGQALQQAGSAVSQFGQQMDEAEAKLERAQLQRKVEESRQAAYQAARDEPDREKRLEIFAAANKDILQYTSASKRRSVNDAMQIYIDNTSPQWNRYYDDLDRQQRVRNARAQLDTLGDEALASGSVNEYLDYLRTGFDSGLFAKDEYDHKVKYAQPDSVLAQAEINAYQNPRRAMEALSDETFRSALDADRLKQAERIMSVANRQFPDVSAEYNKQLTDLMVQGQLTTDEVFARRDFISDKDYQSWAKIAMNPADKPGNVILTAGLKSAAADIWRGTTTRAEFDERLREALASPTGINDREYADIVSTADKELKATQAEDIRRFSRNAAGVILGEFMGIMQFDAMGNVSVNFTGLSNNEIEVAKLRMHFLSLYEQGLRDFIAAKPDVSGREFYQFAQEQKMRYWNTTLEQIKAGATLHGRGGEGVQFEPIGTGQSFSAESAVPTPDELRRQNTREAYEEGKRLGYWN